MEGSTRRGTPRKSEGKLYEIVPQKVRWFYEKCEKSNFCCDIGLS